MDPHPTALIAPSLPVNLVNTGQLHLPTRNRSWPPDLDPMDQIHPFKLNRAVLLKSPQVFPVSQKYPSTLGNSYA
jgi:hypothetical protein